MEEKILSMDEIRQKKLFNLLKRNGNHFMLQREVADRLPKFYPYDSHYDFHNSKSRMLMTKDIQEINDSPDFEKIIISSATGIKLSTKREFNDYIDGQYAQVMARLRRVRTKEAKGNMDGQVRAGVSGEDIDRIISAFISED